MQRQRKRLTFKKYVARRNYKKNYRRVNPTINDVSLKCEFLDLLNITNGGGAYVFDGSASNYLNIADALTGSVSFTEAIPLYSRYKITGMSLKLTRIMDPKTTISALPTVDFAFFPQATSFNSGDSPSYNDLKHSCSVVSFLSQTKYWAFRDNYFEASAGGYGTWNNMGDYLNLKGQISLNSLGSVITTVDATVAEIKLTIYVKFATRNR